MLLGTILSLLIALINSQITCHSDCVPYKCHGPTSRNCNECGPNMVLVGDQCQCMPGWFDDSSGRCHLNVPYCLSVYWDGAAGIWKCSQCETSRDTLNANGSCTRNLVTPFFSRSGAGAYTGSTTNKADVDFFFSNRCKTMDSLGKCLDCYPNARLNPTTGICEIPDRKCAVLDPANPSRCLTAVGGFYVNKTTGQVGNCFYSCKSCSGPAPFDCFSCLEGFYFEKQPNVESGTCRNCDSECVSCFGNSSLDCTKVLKGKYVERIESSTLNQVKNCSSGCYHCESSSNCTHCINLKISLNGVCTATTNNLASCKYQYNTSSTSGICLRWNNNYLTDASLSKFVTSSENVLTWNNCLKINRRQTDRISYDCAQCDFPAVAIYDSGFCRAYLNPPPANCETVAPYSSLDSFCLRCSSNYVLDLDRTCSTSCPAYSNGRAVTPFLS
jgi:proprotein convertase subtilisin/kexin type 5